MLRVAHILRKYQPREWGGTETAVLRLLQGLKAHGVESTVHAPRNNEDVDHDPMTAAASEVKRFKAFVPVAGISDADRERLVAWGGNLFSFELLTSLLSENCDVIHSHALNRLAGAAMTVSKLRKLPFFVTVHGGVLDLPSSTTSQLVAPLKGGFEWGKALGWMVQSRRVLEKADGVLTCNAREAELLQKKYPEQRIIVQPHSVPAAQFMKDHRAAALEAFPVISGRDVLINVGRIDPVKNQGWLVRELPQMIQDHPNLLLVLAGSVTCQKTKAELDQAIAANGLQNHVLLAGGLEPGSPQLIGLLQSARVSVLPSVSETFGIVILEAWAAGTPVISSRTSGAASLINHGTNGMLFDLDAPAGFHESLRQLMQDSPARESVIASARELVQSTYDVAAVASSVKSLYSGIIEDKRRTA
jgi:alpha-maltose-1-phosphate synthase